MIPKAESPKHIDTGRVAQVIVVIGMAGSGKTTFVTRLAAHLRQNQKRAYLVNLDPAVRSVPYACNIDIRDTVNYKNVMKQYGLGPNGAIMTSLNLFATKFHQVLELMENRKDAVDYFIVDTPGQIEVFNWSASGSIILDALAVSFPTTVSFIVDTKRCESPISFTSNMLYACSVLYKTKLPFILTFNKTDLASWHERAAWLDDIDAFCSATQTEDSYAGSLSRSCGITMMEFYQSIRHTGVSSATGDNFSEFVVKLEEAYQEYQSDYVDWLQVQRDAVRMKREQEAASSHQAFQEDLDRDLVLKSSG
ncbi:MAG: uncharacterized protein KVP18_004955 [Porospora cf. gigantea A]|uniref:uncharacterized protein n=1 Tax=Porospora cf. gigantea A TaxID=2853593 RepID=UPI003559C9D5|nr:MAG: hypothetical protein KVP18_004955 [Porospora cf. gigantea A]